MQSTDRDIQIKMMMNSEERHRALVEGYLLVPEIAAAAKRCAFDDQRAEFTSKLVKVARLA